MNVTLGFDVYGTLIDTAGISSALNKFAGPQTVAFAGLWCDKQLEYSFRRGLMQNYQHFAVCTRNALDFCCEALGIEISLQDKDWLMAQYKENIGQLRAGIGGTALPPSRPSAA